MTTKGLFTGIFLALSLCILFTYQIEEVLTVPETADLDNHAVRDKQMEKFKRLRKYPRLKHELLNEFLGWYQIFIYYIASSL